MAQIPKDELVRLKRSVDLVALVRASGVELAPCGGDFRGLCCFHEETSPSFSVRPKGPEGWGLFKCFGCGVGGDCIRLVELVHHVPFRRAVEMLLGGLAGTMPTGTAPSRRPAAILTPDADDQRLLNQVIEYYHQTLLSTTEGAQEYLAKRGLRCPEMVERFKLGYANRTLNYRIPRITSKEGQEVRGRLAAVGIFRETGHEHFAGSLIVPVFDGPAEPGRERNVVEVYGRRVGTSLDKKTPLHLYLKGPHKGVWNEEALVASKEVILAEAPLDALTWWAHGFKGVTTAYGVDGFTADHMAAFRRHGTRRVFIAYDGDDPGDRAAEALAPRLADLGIEVLRVVFPREAKDANDFACQAGPAAVEGLGALLRAARPMGKGSAAPSAPGPAPTVEASPTPSPATNGEASAPPSSEAAPSFPPTPAAEPVGEEAAKGESGAAHEAAPPPSVEDLGAASAPPDADASPFAAAAAPPSLRVIGEEVEMTIGDRAYRVRDLWKNLSLGRMEVNVRVSRGESYHVDSFDLLKARPRELYTKQAALELSVPPEVVKKDLGKLLRELEELQQRRVKKVLTPTPKGVLIPEEEKAEAFALLRDPHLLDRIVEAFDKVGLVGERPNKVVGYLAAVSRKLPSPLAILIQSNSAAGKSALMDAILLLCPDEDVERYTALTAQSLYYMADCDLKHRILAVAEVAGADRAGYPIKMLQSEGRISIATTVKDPTTGEMTTKKRSVEGPVAIFLTTTEAEIDEELQNRALVLTVNEDREQTRAIHEAQRHAETLEGILAAEEREAVVRLHRNAQRLLRPLRVVNPFAGDLAFPDVKLRTRRDHVKYLTLIRAIALLFQYQRPIRQEERQGRVVPYIEVTPQDIAIAKGLADEVLGQSLDDLAPQSRRLLGLVSEMVSRRCAERKIDREDFRFTRREVREYTEWGVTQTRVHLDRLVELEYLLVHHGSRGHNFVYELAYDGRGKDGERFVVGLVDPKARMAGVNGRMAGGDDRMAGSWRPHDGPMAGGWRGPENGSG